MFSSLRGRMPRIGRWPRLALVACCLLLALDSAVTAHAVGKRVPRQVEVGGQSVVVAAKDLAPGRRLGRADVTLARWPAALIPKGVFRRVDQVLGRRLASAVADREAVTGARLVGRDMTTGLPTGLVAVPATLGDAHATDLFHPGDYLDLLATPRPDDLTSTEVPERKPSASAVVVAEHLLVLAVLPATADAAPELVLATDRPTALRVARLGVTEILAGVAVPP